MLLLSGERACCVVTAFTARGNSAGAAALGPWSCSGVILSQSPGIVLCHGALFSPFLLEEVRAAQLGSWLQCKVLLANSFSPDIQIQILWPTESRSKEDPRGLLGRGLEACSPVLGFNPLSSQQGGPSTLRQHEAKLLMIVPCPDFQDTFSKVFTCAEQWHFCKSEHEQECGAFLDDIHCLHWFALLEIPDLNSPGTAQVSCVLAESLRKGDTLFACGSPFGSFCPDIFMNTLSKGVVSNIAGEGNVLILTDARCLPGTEGGGVFVFSEHGFNLVGIIVAPLCWKANEWVGLTLVCSIGHILENIRSILVESGISMKSWWPHVQLVAKPVRNVPASHRPAEHLLSTVVLVECGQVWGSGVLVSSRLVVTCRHVVNEAFGVCVKDQHSLEKGGVLKGKVVFATKEDSPYDIAVVELEENTLCFTKPVLASKFCAGEEVSVVGFGAFGQSCGPSVTSGILSAVITVDDKPVMLQTTCAVHGGSSGGALLSTNSGKLLGIVASNTKDNSMGATYPHLNYSVPITVLQPAVLEYSRTGDLHSFQELNRASDRIRLVWRLQRKTTGALQSKL
uniref:Peroxisomal leader peptide-processing protease n=1 Tax=Pelodiscus sinensis TaxID=13735 RepID=K7G6N9_PELSI|nr:peroxisomal leader peptide-processing protease [Pelodiscus sinensis]|eukprot:XP_006122836.1 peroxisomal leader peptide-processing protease [Pelodiscus sinensis]